MTDTHYVHSLDDALAVISLAERDLIISRLLPDDLLRRAQRVTAGAFDFDGTMHPNNTWAQVGKRLPDDLRAKDAEIRKWYWEQTHGVHQPTSLDDPDWFLGQMPPNGQDVVDGAWVANDVQWYRQAGLHTDDFDSVALELGAREGAIDLLAQFSPRVIISFGIENVIRAWAAHHGLETAIAASRIEFDDDGLVSGNHPNIVTSRTKHAASTRFRELTGIPPEDLLVVGDSVVDAHMMHPDGLNVLILPHSEKDKKLGRFRENNLGAFWDRLSLILFSDSLMPLVELIEQARA